MEAIVKMTIEEVIKDLEIVEEYAKRRSQEDYPKEHMHQVYAEMGYLKATLFICKTKLESLKHIYGVFDSPADIRDREEIKSLIKDSIVLSKEAAYEDNEIYLKASWSKNHFYGIEINPKGKKDNKGEDLSFYWDNDYWLYNLANGDKEAIQSAQEDLTERETLFVITFLKELVDRGILKENEKELSPSAVLLNIEN